MKRKEDIKKGDKVYFHSGNFWGHYGIVSEVDWNTNDKRAIYGFLHSVILDDGREVFIEKAEHWGYANT